MLIKSDFDLTPFNSYSLKAHCGKAFFPETEEEICRIYEEYQDKSKIIIGNGNNIILSKERYDDYFIILNGCFEDFQINKEIISAEAGVTMLMLSEIALKYSLSGLEIFYDIPSSVGGAIFMNAGANGEEIGNLVTKVRYIDLEDFKIKEKIKEELEFEYRNSFFQQNSDKFILKAWFKLAPGDYSAIKYKMETTRRARWDKQPRDYPNCGSVFKRPTGKFVGPMLDELGLKGFKIGGAQISEKHSGFIVNTGGASGKDILNLIKEVQNRVKEKFGIELEIEQRVI